jgi:3-methyladenine DNA glycosylase/8-oxoguanine DNA glycosylase
VTAEVEFRPVAPYLLQSCLGAPDLTRRRFPGGLELVFEAEDSPAYARAWQTRDGRVLARIDAAEEAAAHDRLREILRIDADHRPFLKMVDGDRLLEPLRTRLRGMRPLLLGSVPHALMRGVCGQLIRTGEALEIERRIVARLSPRHGGLRLPPTAEAIMHEHPARFERAGLSPQRAALLSRASKQPWAALATESSDRVEARLRSLRGLGAWTAGHVLLHGYGRFDRGLAGDLALVRLATRLLGRPADTADTERLIEPYGEWRGLASLWLMHHPLAARHAIT